MKKLTIALFLVLITVNANAFTFVKSVSMDFNESIIFDIVDYCIDQPDQDKCVIKNIKAAKRIYNKVFHGLDTDLNNVVNQCERKFFPDFQRIELCSM